MKKEQITNILKNVWGSEWDTLTETQQEKHIKDFIKRQEKYNKVEKMAKEVFEKVGA